MTELINESLFHVGQLVKHQRLGYRGVVVDVDPVFTETDAWHEEMASAPTPKDQPWYRVLRHGSAHETYVAQQHLLPDASGERIRHPLLWLYFEDFRDGVYLTQRRAN